MPDGPFKSMTMDREEREARRRRTVPASFWTSPGPFTVSMAPSVTCEKCGALVYEGDWPAEWCKGKPEDHER